MSILCKRRIPLIPLLIILLIFSGCAPGVKIISPYQTVEGKCDYYNIRVSGDGDFIYYVDRAGRRDVLVKAEKESLRIVKRYPFRAIYSLAEWGDYIAVVGKLTNAQEGRAQWVGLSAQEVERQAGEDSPSAHVYCVLLPKSLKHNAQPIAFYPDCRSEEQVEYGWVPFAGSLFRQDNVGAKPAELSISEEPDESAQSSEGWYGVTLFNSFFYQDQRYWVRRDGDAAGTFVMGDTELAMAAFAEGWGEPFTQIINKEAGTVSYLWRPYFLLPGGSSPIWDIEQYPAGIRAERYDLQGKVLLNQVTLPDARYMQPLYADERGIIAYAEAERQFSHISWSGDIQLTEPRITFHPRFNFWEFAAPSDIQAYCEVWKDYLFLYEWRGDNSGGNGYSLVSILNLSTAMEER